MRRVRSGLCPKMSNGSLISANGVPVWWMGARQIQPGSPRKNGPGAKIRNEWLSRLQLSPSPLPAVLYARGSCAAASGIASDSSPGVPGSKVAASCPARRSRHRSLARRSVDRGAPPAHGETAALSCHEFAAPIFRRVRPSRSGRQRPLLSTTASVPVLLRRWPECAMKSQPNCWPSLERGAGLPYCAAREPRLAELWAHSDRGWPRRNRQPRFRMSASTATPNPSVRWSARRMPAPRRVVTRIRQAARPSHEYVGPRPNQEGQKGTRRIQFNVPYAGTALLHADQPKIVQLHARDLPSQTLASDRHHLGSGGSMRCLHLIRLGKGQDRARSH